jgi:hypothetical protein
MLCLPTGFGKREIVAALQEDHPEHAAPSGAFDGKKPASAPTIVGRTVASPSNCRS